MDVHLRVIQGQPLGKYLVFPPGEFLIGNGPECQVRSLSACVSRQHCLLCVDQNGLLVRDLGSAAGTLVNGTLLHDERRLVDGDLLQLGPVVLQVSAGPPTPAVAA